MPQRINLEAMMNSETVSKESYDFVLVLDGVSTLDDAIMNALWEVGCQDATPCLRSGRLYLAFSLDAASLQSAILSAMEDVKRAQIGATILSIDECNLVSQAEIARRVNRTGEQAGGNVAQVAFLRRSVT
jgi:hypothetical protein